MLKLAEQRQRQRRSMTKWYQGNKDWYVQYRQDNPEKIREAFERYRDSPKGQIAVKRYEQKPHRKAAKAFWNFKKNLEDQVEAGTMKRKEMEIRIRHRKLVDSGRMTPKQMLDRIVARRKIHKKKGRRKR